VPVADDEPTRQSAAPAGIYDDAGRPRFFDDPSIDRLISVVLNLTSEVWVLTERLENLEQLAQRKGHLTYEEIKNYKPDADETRSRDAARDSFVRSVLGPLREVKRGAKAAEGAGNS
jgi:hypothetical protein